MSGKPRGRRIPSNFRLSAEAKELLARLADRRGTSQAAVLEMAIRDEARKAGVTLSKEEAEALAMADRQEGEGTGAGD